MKWKKYATIGLAVGASYFLYKADHVHQDIKSNAIASVPSARRDSLRRAYDITLDSILTHSTMEIWRAIPTAEARHIPLLLFNYKPEDWVISDHAAQSFHDAYVVYIDPAAGFLEKISLSKAFKATGLKFKIAKDKNANWGFDIRENPKFRKDLNRRATRYRNGKQDQNVFEELMTRLGDALANVTVRFGKRKSTKDGAAGVAARNVGTGRQIAAKYSAVNAMKTASDAADRIARAAIDRQELGPAGIAGVDAATSVKKTYDKILAEKRKQEKIKAASMAMRARTKRPQDDAGGKNKNLLRRGKDSARNLISRLTGGDNEK